MILTLKNGAKWKFEWECLPGSSLFGWLCHQRKHTYRIFFDDVEFKQMWVGRYFAGRMGDGGWYTVEQEIGAVSLEWDDGVFFFRQKAGESGG